MLNALIALARSLDTDDKARAFLLREQARSLTPTQRVLLRLSRRAEA